MVGDSFLCVQPGWRAMEEKDCGRVAELLSTYLKKFNIGVLLY